LKLIKLTDQCNFARGLTLGQRIRDICVHNLAFLKQKLAQGGLSVERGLGLATENERVIAKHFPELLEEIRGLAQGAQLPYEHILLETAFPFAAYASRNCTVISALGTVTTDTVPVVARNYDFLSDFAKCNQVRVVRSRKFSFVGGTVTMLGVEEGLNNAGLFIGDAGCEPKGVPSSRGLSSRQVMQLVLENCGSVDGAIDFLYHAPKFANNAGTCYLLADKREAVVVEMGLTQGCLRRSDEGVLVASNVFLTGLAEEMKPPEPGAFAKCERTREYLHENRGRVDSRLLRELLSDHTVHMCAHNEINTLRSVVARTNESKVLVSDGHPCISKFEEVLIPTR
jgi:isopenicillin-N N-acyltransferase-like protein